MQSTTQQPFVLISLKTKQNRPEVVKRAEQWLRVTCLYRLFSSAWLPPSGYSGVKHFQDEKISNSFGIQDAIFTFQYISTEDMLNNLLIYYVDLTYKWEVRIQQNVAGGSLCLLVSWAKRLRKPGLEREVQFQSRSHLNFLYRSRIEDCRAEVLLLQLVGRLL